MSALQWSLLLGGAAAAANVLGGLVVAFRREWNDLYQACRVGLTRDRIRQLGL